MEVVQLKVEQAEGVEELEGLEGMMVSVSLARVSEGEGLLEGGGDLVEVEDRHWKSWGSRE